MRTDPLGEVPLALLSEVPLFFSQSDLSEVVTILVIRVHVLVLLLLVFYLVIFSVYLLFFFDVSVLVEVLHQAEQFGTKVFAN